MWRITIMNNYNIGGTKNLDENEVFKDVNSYPMFQEHLGIFKNELMSLVNNNEAKTFYKFGDGDYYFLKKEAVGSATPGRRALSKNYDDITHDAFVSGVEENDFITVEIYNHSKFNELYPNRIIDFPAEYGYGLVANKWLLENFSGKIGLIGASEKIQLIEKLMEYSEYQNYLRLEQFEDYLTIPQKFACDDIDELEKSIGKQLEDSTASIFLLGIGHVKSALLHRLKKYKNAVFLDVGSGIDALAGIIDHQRPYMGDWVNYRTDDFDYGCLDILQYDIWNTEYELL